MEQPVTRTVKKSSSHGWLDYWVYFHTSDLIAGLSPEWVRERADWVDPLTKNRIKTFLFEYNSECAKNAHKKLFF
jgi:hypothetical protein